MRGTPTGREPMVAESVANPDNPQVNRQAGAGHSDSVAVLVDDEANYEEAAVAALAAALAMLGVRPDERVLIMMPDESGFEEAIIGTIQMAGVPLPVNPELSAGDLATVAGEAGARLAVVAGQGTDALNNLSTELAMPVDGPQGTWATILLLA